MDAPAFLRGLALGLAVAAPVGPMSLLCMRQTLVGGFLAGFVSGLGIATADAVFGAIAAFGLVAIADVLVGQQGWLRLIGGTIVAYLGIRTLRARPAEEVRSVDRRGRGLGGRYAATFALTLTNPSTILSFAALFAGFGLGSAESGLWTALAMVSGVFLGSALWWLILTAGIGLARARLSQGVQRAVNVAAGLALVGFGLAALASTLT